METLAQITTDGGINIGYVFNGLITLVMFLFWHMISGMKTDIKEMKQDMSSLKTAEASRDQQIKNIESKQGEFSDIGKKIQQNLYDMALKIETLRALRDSE